jgi:hypothetical protein
VRFELPCNPACVFSYYYYYLLLLLTTIIYLLKHHSSISPDFVSTEDATQLRLADKECLKLITSHPWKDSKTIVPNINLPQWKECFPNARALKIGKKKRGKNVRGMWPAKHFKGMNSILHLVITGTNFRSEDFRHFPNLKVLECGDNPMVQSFSHLMNLEKLVMLEVGVGALITHVALPQLRTLHINCCDFVMPLSDLTEGAPWVSRLENLEIATSGSFPHYIPHTVRLLTPGAIRPFQRHSVFPSQYFKAFGGLKSLSLKGYLRDIYRDWGYRECHFLHFKHLSHFEINGMGDIFSAHFFSILRDRGVRWNAQNCHPMVQFVATGVVLKSHPKFECACE